MGLRPLTTATPLDDRWISGYRYVLEADLLGGAIRRKHGQPEADAGIGTRVQIDGVLPGIVRASREMAQGDVEDV